METKQPKITLVNFTPKPLHSVAWACSLYKGLALEHLDYVPVALRRWFANKDEDVFALNDDEVMIKFLAPFLKDPTSTAMEFIQMTFLIENVSRAFQQQLTRHRMASYIIHSLRVFQVGKFAEEGRYTRPSTVKNVQAYHEEMLNIQNAYNQAIEKGENVEDARGLLPLNLHSTISMRVDFSALRHILRGRLCVTAQEEARKIGYLFKKAVAMKMGKWFGDLLQPPCHKLYGGVCTNTPNFCGIPLYAASTNPQEFKRWYARTGGKPEGSRIPTNSTFLPEDMEQVEIALSEANEK